MSDKDERHNINMQLEMFIYPNELFVEPAIGRETKTKNLSHLNGNFRCEFNWSAFEM